MNYRSFSSSIMVFNTISDEIEIYLFCQLVFFLKFLKDRHKLPVKRCFLCKKTLFDRNSFCRFSMNGAILHTNSNCLVLLFSHICMQNISLVKPSPGCYPALILKESLNPFFQAIWANGSCA